MLNEATYDLSELNPFFKFVRGVLDHSINKRFDATHFFKKYIPKKSNAKVIVQIDPVYLNTGNVAKRPSLVRGAAGFSKKANTLYIFINSFFLFKPSGVDKIKEINALMNTLKHESIHVLDYLRSLKAGDKPSKEITIRIRKPDSVITSRGIETAKDYVKYMSDVYEFNAAVNIFKIHLKENPKEKEKFLKLNDVEKVKMFAEIFHASSSNQESLKTVEGRRANKEFLDQVGKDNKFINKVIKRLHRENLLENNFKSKVKDFLIEDE